MNIIIKLVIMLMAVIGVSGCFSIENSEEVKKVKVSKLDSCPRVTIEQLVKVKTLYLSELDSALREGIKRDYPHLLEEPRR